MNKTMAKVERDKNPTAEKTQDYGGQDTGRGT